MKFISRTAKLGKNVVIWHFTYVGHHTKIGDNTKIGSLVHIDYDVRIGSNCKIEGQAYIPPLSRIGNNVFIGPAAVLTNDPYPMSEKMTGVTVADGAVIGAGAVIKAGVTIGKNSIVGMGSVVTEDVPADAVVFGNPAALRYARAEYDLKKDDWDNKNKKLCRVEFANDKEKNKAFGLLIHSKIPFSGFEKNAILVRNNIKSWLQQQGIKFKGR